MKKITLAFEPYAFMRGSFFYSVGFGEDRLSCDHSPVLRFAVNHLTDFGYFVFIRAV